MRKMLTEALSGLAAILDGEKQLASSHKATQKPCRWYAPAQHPLMASSDLQLYGVPLDAADSDPRLMERRLDLAHSAATLLDRNNLINYDRRSGTVRVCKPRLSLASCHQILDVVHAFSFKLCTQ